MKYSTEVESRILLAAERVFYRKGKDGASMQEIAVEANITRTSLNYYYRTKDKLFEAVFRKTMMLFIPEIGSLINEDQSFRDFLINMVNVIIDTMMQNPHIPIFVLQELSSNPERMPKIVSDMGLSPDMAVSTFSRNEDLTNLSISPMDVVLNVISMSIFPFAAKPMLLALMFQGDEEAYYKAMGFRKEVIRQMIDTMLNSKVL